VGLQVIPAFRENPVCNSGLIPTFAFDKGFRLKNGIKGKQV
jgi:hypothetical protein